MNKVNQYTNTRFKMDTPQGSEMFMLYSYEGKTYVRASICPPCRSQSFALTKGTLVCDSCGTVFDAVTGKGISGDCVAYPKQSTQYQVNGDSLTVSKADLIAAYQKTLNQGK